MKLLTSVLALAVAAPALLITTSTSSEARIRCNGPWQYVDGSQLASPFCGDEYLAEVARGYGMRVSGRAIRGNFSVKSDACHLVGHDNRVNDICTGFRNENDGDDGDNTRG